MLLEIFRGLSFSFLKDEFNEAAKLPPSHKELLTAKIKKVRASIDQITAETFLKYVAWRKQKFWYDEMCQRERAISPVPFFQAENWRQNLIQAVFDYESQSDYFSAVFDTEPTLGEAKEYPMTDHFEGHFSYIDPSKNFHSNMRDHVIPGLLQECAKELGGEAISLETLTSLAEGEEDITPKQLKAYSKLLDGLESKYQEYNAGLIKHMKTEGVGIGVSMAGITGNDPRKEMIKFADACSKRAFYSLKSFKNRVEGVFASNDPQDSLSKMIEYYGSAIQNSQENEDQSPLFDRNDDYDLAAQDCFNEFLWTAKDPDGVTYMKKLQEIDPDIQNTLQALFGVNNQSPGRPPGMVPAQ